MKFLRFNYLFVIAVILISLAMCFPQSLSFFIFLFLIPILLYIDKCSLDFSKKKAIAEVMFKMFLFGLFFATVSSFWFFSTYPLDWLGIGVNDSVLSIFIIGSVWFGFSLLIAFPLSFWVLFVYKLKNNNLFYNAITGSSVWVLLDYIKSWIVAFSTYSTETLLGPHHTYYSLAYTVSSTPIVKELLPIGGIYLTSFLIILINYFLYYLFLNNKKDTKNQVMVLGFLIVMVLVFSNLYMKNIRIKNFNGEIVIISVINTYLPASTSTSTEQLRRVTVFNILSKINNKDGVIVIPENLNVLNLISENKDKKNINLIKRNNLIIGSYHFGDYYAMYFFNPQNNEIKYYAKQLLMPIGEYSVSWIRFLIGLTYNKNWLNIYDNYIHTAKKGSGIFLYKNNEKSFVISGGLCSENISPYIYRDEAMSGAEILLNLSSRSDFHNSKLLFRQTIAINTTRALENGRYLITATNKDKSFVVTDTGTIQDISTSTDIISYFNSRIQAKNYITPYVKYGDYMVFFSIVIIVVSYILAS